MKKLLALVMAVLTAISLVPASFAAFTDAEGDFAEAIQYVYDAGLMNGIGDGKFAPEAGVTRAMVWTVLARLSDVELDESEPWWESARQWAMSVGITDGTMAENVVTLEQLITMLYRYAILQNVVFVPGELDVLAGFPDKDEVSDWAYPAMQWAVTVGLIDTDAATLSPKAETTRGELAEKLYDIKDVDLPGTVTPEVPVTVYTVTLLDGANIVSILTVKEGEALGTLPVLSKPGFFFSGWFTSDGVRASAGTVVNGSLTLFARYMAVSVGGGSGTHYCSIEWTTNENGYHEGYCTDAKCGRTYAGPCADGNDADTLCDSCKDDLSVYEANRNGVFYENLTDALALGGTVYLMKNIVRTEAIVIAAGTTVTLDLSGYTISYTSALAGSDALIKNNGNLTVQDTSAAKSGRLTFDATAPDTAAVPGYASNVITNAGHLTVNGGTIENLAVGSAVYAIDSAWHSTDVSVTVNGGTITSQKIAIRQVPYSATAKNVLTVNGGSVYGGVSGLQVFHTAGSPTANLSETYLTGGSVSGGTYAFYTSFLWAGAHQNAKFVVTGGDYEGWVYLYNGKSGSSAYPVNFSISGGSFRDGVLIYTKDENGQTVNAEVVTGGTYGTDMNAYCAEGYNAVEENGVWTVKIMNRNDVRTEKALRYLLSTDGAVRLGADITLTDALTVPAGVTATLDLTGHVLSQEKTQTGAYSMLVNKGDLLITDSVGGGVIRYADTGAGGEYVSNTVSNSGVLTVADATIENVSSEAMAHNGYAHGIDNSGTLTITGGTIRSEYYSSVRIWCTEDDDTVVTITGGTFYGSVDLHNVNDRPNKGTLTITGGTFLQNSWTPKVIRLVNFGTQVEGLSASVTGATIDGVIGISGSQTDEKYLKLVFGFTPAQNVTTGKNYLTIQEAVDNVENGETILIREGNYASEVIDVTGGKTFTLKAAEGTTVVLGGIDHQSNGADSTVLFENLTINNATAAGWYTGTSQKMGVCVGAWGGNLTFTNCRFEVAGTSGRETGVMTWWTTDTVSLTFTGCTFTGIDGHANARAMQIYGKVNLTVTGCTFDTKKDYTLKYVGDENCTATFSGNTVSHSENFVELGSSGYPGKDCTASFSGNVLTEGVNLYVIAHDENQTVIIDGKIFVAEGIVQDPTSQHYEISSAAGLMNFAKMVNEGGKTFKNETVKLVADIDLNNQAFTPIGQTGATEFEGVFDGQNYTISGLLIDSSDKTGKHYSSGLFGWIESSSHVTVKNVKVNGASVTGHHNVAVIVGYLEGDAVVENCHVVNATLSNTVANEDANGDKTGVIAGYAAASVRIKSCSAVSSTVSSGRDAGQIVGAAKTAVVENCTATGVTVTANGTGTGKNINEALIGRVL